MGDMVQDLHNMEEDMEYYWAKLHQVYKSIEVINMFFLLKHKLFTILELKLCEHNF